jgi:hypothetical protein
MEGSLTEAVSGIILSELTRGWPGSSIHESAEMLGPMLMDMIMSVDPDGDVNCTYLSPDVWGLEDDDQEEFDAIVEAAVYDSAVAVVYVLQVSGLDTTDASAFKGLIFGIHCWPAEPEWILARLSDGTEMHLDENGEMVLNDVGDITFTTLTGDDNPNHPIANTAFARLKALKEKE